MSGIQLLSGPSADAVQQMKNAYGKECAGFLAIMLAESELRRRMYDAVKKAFAVQELPQGALARYEKTAT
jgi:hypothetical protein